MLATLDVVVSDDDIDAAAAWLIEQAHSMQLAATAMQRALDDMLNLATVQTGELQLHEAPFSVRSLVRDIRHYAGVSFGGARFQCWVAPNVPERACADRLRVRGLVADTVRQAQLYSQTARLGVECVTLDADRSLLVFAVWGLDLTDTFDERRLAKKACTSVDKMLHSMQWKPTRVALSSAATVPSTNGCSSYGGGSQSSGPEWADDPSGTGAISLVLVRAMAEAMGGTMGTFHVPVEEDPAPGANVAEASGPKHETVLCVAVPVTIVLNAKTPPANAQRASQTTGLDVVVVHQAASTRRDEFSTLPHEVQHNQVSPSTTQAFDAKAVEPCTPTTRHEGKASKATWNFGTQQQSSALCGGPTCEERGMASSTDAVASAGAPHVRPSAVTDDGSAPAVAQPTSENTGTATTRVAEHRHPAPVVAVGQSASAPTSPGVVLAKPRKKPVRRARRRRKRGDHAEKLSPLVQCPEGVHHVIVVDDERLIRKVVCDQLKRLRVSDVISLEDGDELVHTLDGAPQPPTCVLLDIVMRRSNGVSILESLRQHPRWSKLSVYAMTSNVESVDLFKASGFDGLLGKPFTRQQLVAVLSHSMLPRASRDPFFSVSR